MTSPTSYVVCFFASLIMLAVAGWTRPDSAECAEHWYISLRGDRCNGCYACRPVQPSYRDSRGHEPDEPDDPRYDVEVSGAIHCTGGARPIVVSARKVGCQRGGWSE